MTTEERKQKLSAFIKCLKCEVSGHNCDDNCPTQYEAGNMGEIIENLEEILKILEQEPILDKIREEVNKLFVSLGDGSEEWRSCVNETVLEVLQILDKYKADRSEEE